MTRAIAVMVPFPRLACGQLYCKGFPYGYCIASIRTGVINFRSTLSEYQVAMDLFLHHAWLTSEMRN